MDLEDFLMEGSAALRPAPEKEEEESLLLKPELPQAPVRPVRMGSHWLDEWESRRDE